MSVLAEFSVIPVGKGESLSPYVARCVEEVKRSGLPYQLHAMGTEVEADSFAQVAEIIGRCIERLSADCERIEVNLQLDYRKGRRQMLTEKVASVERLVKA